MSPLRALVRLAVTGLVLVAPVVAATPAQADCTAPTVSVSPSVVRPGATVTVEGESFGTDCHDTGPVPSGSVLGDPATGIVLVLVDGTDERRLATVDAAQAYTFRQDVLIPTTASGALTLRADLSAGYSPDSVDLTVRGHPLPAPETPPVTATQASSRGGDRAADPVANGGSTMTLLAVGGGLGAMLAVLLLVRRSLDRS